MTKLRHVRLAAPTTRQTQRPNLQPARIRGHGASGYREDTSQASVVRKVNLDAQYTAILHLFETLACSLSDSHTEKDLAGRVTRSTTGPNYSARSRQGSHKRNRKRVDAEVMGEPS